MVRRTIVAAAVLLGLAAAPAQAAEEPGLVLGRHVFGPVACGTPTIHRATMADPTVVAGADETACRIVLNREYASSLPAAMRCTLVLHEYGHLAGHEHSTDRDSVMYPTYEEPDERCVRATRPFSADSRSASSRGRRGRGTSGTATRSGSAARR